MGWLRGGARWGAGFLNLAHRRQQSLLSAVGRGIAISLQQLSEIPCEVRIGQQACPVRSLRARFRITHGNAGCLYGELVRLQLELRIIPPQDNLSHLAHGGDPGGAVLLVSEGSAV